MTSNSTHILSAGQFSRQEIEDIFARADEFSTQLERDGKLHLLDKKTAAVAFYEPGERARMSFENAVKALGGGILSMGDAKTAGDYVKMLRATVADAVILRHPDSGAAQLAARTSPVPIINAGDGTGEDPSEALAELLALRREKKGLDGLRIALVGDLKNDRLAHSLALVLAQFDVYVSLVAPAAMSLPYDLSDAMRARGITVEETNDLARVLERADAVILSPVKQRYFPDPKNYEKMSNFYRLGDLLEKKRGETWLGGTWQDGKEFFAKVHEKTGASGLGVRMALLAKVLE